MDMEFLSHGAERRPRSTDETLGIYDIRYTIYERVGSRELYSRVTTPGPFVGTKFHRAFFKK